MTDQIRQQQIKEAIYQTIVFFDIFSYPLSSSELWQFLSVKCSLLEVEEALPELDELKVAKAGAFYFLKDRQAIIETRSRRANYSDRKIKRAIRVSRIFRFIPWIKMIAIGNLIGSNNLKDASDIDFFIITEKNRIWLTRFISALIAKLLMQRPKVNDTRDKICLSFYISEAALDLSPRHLEDTQDLYFIYWLAGLLPIYQKPGMYAELIEKNPWLKKTLPNWEPVQVSSHRTIEAKSSILYRDTIDMLLGGLEKYVKKLQLKILPNDLRQMMNKDTRVVINDTVLKLHFNDRRREYKEEFVAKMARINKI